MKKRIFCLTMAVLMLLSTVFTLASCGNPPVDPGTTQTCTNHVDANHDGKCDNTTCQAAVTPAHVDANHDGKCDVPTCVNKKMEVKHDDANKDYVCDTCEQAIAHDCVEENGKCKLCGKDMEAGEHTCVDNTDDGLCDVCGEEIVVEGCEQCIDLDGDGVCDVCEEDTNCVCVDDNGDSFCDKCQAYVEPAGGEDDVEYPWDTTTIIMQLTENTNGQEILSVSRKYLAGDPKAGSDSIATSVQKRNSLASIKTKVRVDYRYYPDTKEYNWGTSIERIQSTNMAGVDVPDVYCNFVYDMVGASLKECFANLLAENVSAVRGENYFEFLDADYDDSTDDRGYMYEYMQSLTLAPGKKMYVLASDYFIDMVRAFFCVPVSVTIMEASGADIVAQGADGTVYAGGDRNGDGVFNLDDFYALVNAGEWTYDTLAKFADAVYQPAATNDGVCNIGDDVVGFAMASGGLSASGLLYTTSVEIIKKEDNGQGGYEYNYPSNNEDFYAFCDATTKLFGESKGVCFVNANYSQFGDSSLLAIRNRFVQNKVLFGDVMLVGALEFDVYQEMKDKGGFGVVPVPLYRTGSDDKYLTQIHNMGSCGAISIVTKKFSECTAFLNYQSTNSEEILNNYYKYKLQYDLSNNSTGTVEMLQYIRDNVRSSFDKAMEDAIGVFNTEASKTKWHNVLSTASFQVDIRTQYQQSYNAKEKYLDDLAKAFQNFPD